MSAIAKRRWWRFRDSLAGVRGSLVCALVIVLLDVVNDGGFMFAAVVCPIWVVVGMIRTLAPHPSLGVAAARILIPVVTGLLVVANYSMQGRIAMANAARVIQACERYRGATGAYPERLSDLVPRYLSSVPRAKYCCSRGEFVYDVYPQLHTLFWFDSPPFGTRVYNFETGRWHHIE
jgi:hypothetical protein